MCDVCGVMCVWCGGWGDLEGDGNRERGVGVVTGRRRGCWYLCVVVFVVVVVAVDNE